MSELDPDFSMLAWLVDQRSGEAAEGWNRADRHERMVALGEHWRRY